MVWITRISISLESCLRLFLQDLCSFSIICILFQFIQVQIPIHCCRKNTKNGCKLFTLDCIRTVNTANCCRRFQTECRHFHSFMGRLSHSSSTWVSEVHTESMRSTIRKVELQRVRQSLTILFPLSSISFNFCGLH